MKHELWSVWKGGFNPGSQWLVQMPKGIVGFRTKKAATAFAKGNLRIEEVAAQAARSAAALEKAKLAASTVEKLADCAAIAGNEGKAIIWNAITHVIRESSR